jgi:hypothetical protein
MSCLFIIVNGPDRKEFVQFVKDGQKFEELPSEPPPPPVDDMLFKVTGCKIPFC